MGNAQVNKKEWQRDKGKDLINELICESES